MRQYNLCIQIIIIIIIKKKNIKVKWDGQTDRRGERVGRREIFFKFFSSFRFFLRFTKTGP